MHRWRASGHRTPDWQRYYRDWLFGRRTLSQLCGLLGISYPTLTAAFDVIDIPEGLQVEAPAHAINLLVDATFFGRDYGYLCFHDTRRIIWFREIRTEGIKHIRKGLRELQEAKFRIKSVTIDGRRGYYGAIRKMLGPVPIQMCLFHQKAIVRRYLTDRPQSICGKELSALMKSLCVMEHGDFIHDFYSLKEQHRHFLEERNVQGDYKHRAVRSAFTSLQDNLPSLFTYRDIPDIAIPPTINHLEGAFGHLKEKIKIHRALRIHRKKRAIKFILNSPPLFNYALNYENAPL